MLKFAIFTKLYSIWINKFNSIFFVVVMWRWICPKRKGTWSKRTEKREIGGELTWRTKLSQLWGGWRPGDGCYGNRGIDARNSRGWWYLRSKTEWRTGEDKCGNVCLCSLNVYLDVSESSSVLRLINTQHKVPINQSIAGTGACTTVNDKRGSTETVRVQTAFKKSDKTTEPILTSTDITKGKNYFQK